MTDRRQREKRPIEVEDALGRIGVWLLRHNSDKYSGRAKLEFIYSHGKLLTIEVHQPPEELA